MPRIPTALFSLAVALSMCGTSAAETLQDALVAAYKTNPQLQEQRAQLRVTDETYVQTAAQFAPTVSLQVQGSYDREHLSKSERALQRPSNPNLPDFVEQNQVSGQLVISEPLYTSGRLSADKDAAAAQVRAGREALRTTEANVLYSVILAYADIERDQQAVDIRKLNLDMLQHQVDETVARQRAGEVTRTDVAQAQAQLASEQALYQAAQQQVIISGSNFSAVVGRQPDSLAPLPEMVGVPKTFDGAISAAERDNPDLLQAIWLETGSHSKIYAARSSLGPNVSMQLQSGYQGSLVPFDKRDLNRGLGLTATVIVPLYSGGLAQSQVRQAVDQNSADQMAVDDVHRAVIKNMATLWSQRQIALNDIDADTRQIAAAQIAFEGMRKEYSAGERSTLDVLVAEETLRDAELSLISARHDAYVISAALLQNMGWLELHNLAESDYYDAAAHIPAVTPKLGVPWQPVFQKIDALGTRKVQPETVAHTDTEH